jgi:hypothetical protein
MKTSAVLKPMGRLSVYLSAAPASCQIKTSAMSKPMGRLSVCLGEAPASCQTLSPPTSEVKLPLDAAKYARVRCRHGGSGTRLRVGVRWTAWKSFGPDAVFTDSVLPLSSQHLFACDMRLINAG